MKLNDKNIVNWTLLSYEDWKLYIAATSKGLCFVGSQESSFEELENWVKQNLNEYSLLEDDDALKPYVFELIEYLKGNIQNFTIPMDFYGTPFQIEVWNALNNIPFGETRTYSEIAKLINRPKAARAVGGAIGANSILITVPCHRVIGSNGTLTGFRGGFVMKTKLLEIEQSSSKMKGMIPNAISY